MQKILLKKTLIIAIILLISSIFSPLLTADNLSNKNFLVSFTVYGKSDVINCEAMLSYDETIFINDLFKELQYELTYHPNSDETESLKSSFVEFLDNKGLLPDGISNNEIFELLNPPYIHQLIQKNLLNCFLPSLKISSTKGTAFFCSVASGGSGKTTPIVIGPRPHAIVLWKGIEGQEYTVTTVGGIRSGKGFIAYGNQNGMLIGFEGIGLTYGTPFGTIYGLTGYAIYASVTADYIEFYPPNSKPEISNPIPSDNQENIPLTLNKLIFTVKDDDNDLMSYSVTTTPGIGSDSGTSKNGICSINIHDLQSSTNYKWKVEVSDGKDTTTEIFSFTTIMDRPIVTNPNPADGSSTTTDLSELSFTLTDAQGDKMDYTIQTSPNIGSSSATGVGNGTYSLQISKLKENIWYYWYVNVTDGVHLTKEIFRFYTGGLGLVCYWSFNEVIGNILHDQTEYNNDGIINGANWVPGIEGYALKFTSDSDIVSSIPPSWDNNIGNVFTISCWINWDGPTEKNIFYIFDGRDDSWDMAGFILYIDNSNKLGLCWFESDSSSVSSDSEIPIGKWTHVAVVFNGESDYFKIYIDGALDKTVSTTATHRDSDNYAAIGNNHWGHIDGEWRPFNGVIDELRIYSNVLAQNDINELYTFGN